MKSQTPCTVVDYRLIILKKRFKMKPLTALGKANPRIPFAYALIVTLAMGFAYTYLDTIQFQEPIQSFLSFLPAVISLSILSVAGISRLELKLRILEISKAGLVALAATTLLLLPILTSSSAYVGWQWLPALIYAPSSGLAQELYFRSALLTGLERAFSGRKTIALIAHSLIFIGFHYRTFQALPSVVIVLVVGAVLFLGGCGWGWQVQRDRTIIWAVIQHSLFLMLMSMFEWS